MSPCYRNFWISKCLFLRVLRSSLELCYCRLRSSGRITFIVTNSNYEYTRVGPLNIIRDFHVLFFQFVISRQWWATYWSHQTSKRSVSYAQLSSVVLSSANNIFLFVVLSVVIEWQWREEVLEELFWLRHRGCQEATFLWRGLHAEGVGRDHQFPQAGGFHRLSPEGEGVQRR